MATGPPPPPSTHRGRPDPIDTLASGCLILLTTGAAIFLLIPLFRELPAPLAIGLMAGVLFSGARLAANALVGRLDGSMIARRLLLELPLLAGIFALLCWAFVAMSGDRPLPWVHLLLLGGLALVIQLFVSLFDFVVSPILLYTRNRSAPPLDGEAAAWLRDASLRELGRPLVPRRLAHQGMNAFATGVVPGGQFILVQDRLARLLPPAEMKAILGHELGHLRLHHLPRSLVLAGGIGVLAALGGVALREVIGAGLAEDLVSGGWFVLLNTLGPHLLRPWVHRMEFQADAFGAARTSPRALAGALLRIARHDQIDTRRNSPTHPSMRRRLRALRDLRKEAGRAPESPGAGP